MFNDLACCSSFSWSSLIRLGSCVWYQERKTLLLCNLQNCNSLSLDLNMAKPIQLCFIPIHLCQRYSKSHLQGFDKLIVEFIKLWYIRHPCYRGWCLYKYWMTLVLLFHAFNSWGNLSGESSQFLRTEKLNPDVYCIASSGRLYTHSVYPTQNPLLQLKVNHLLCNWLSWVRTVVVFVFVVFFSISPVPCNYGLKVLVVLVPQSELAEVGAFLPGITLALSAWINFESSCM